MIERWLPIAASAHAASFDTVLASIHAQMLAIFVVWLAVFAAAIVRFRASVQPVPCTRGASGVWPALAIGAAVLANAAVLATQALPAWQARMAPPPAGAAAVEIHITAEQFAWNIHYPGPDGTFGRTSPGLISASNPIGIDRDDPAAADDIGLLNILTLPLNRIAVLELTARDVVHSFSVAEMRVKQDAVPGVRSRVWFTPIRAGVWDIACAQLCGLGHYRMRGELRVLPVEDWERWQADELARMGRR
jgi:cytochrome c oxidase subunit 2